MSSALWREIPSYAVWFAIALALGALASWALARRLKRRTFGLELDEIALLLQEREATLHGIREGVIAIDTAGRVSMVNDEAQRLLGLDLRAVGQPLAELLPPGTPAGGARRCPQPFRTTSCSPTTTPSWSTGCRSRWPAGRTARSSPFATAPSSPRCSAS